MRRNRSTKIVATMGPSSTTPERIAELFKAGVDVFRMNFSHGSHEDHKARYDIIRVLEKEFNHPIAVMCDLQGPKLRVGRFAEGKVMLETGQDFRLDLDATLGDKKRVQLPHPEIFAAIEAGMDLLVDDGKRRLRVKRSDSKSADTEVIIGGEISNNKGVNVPDAVLALSALTPKDRRDMEFALGLGMDYVALSFVQRPEDVAEARKLINRRAAVMVKLEKPSAILHLDSIIELTDAAMVARGDLGVEMPPEDVPGIQKRIIRACRQTGKPVIVATQMLDSMVSAPTPTRAEASDVATAVYDGADAVMLSAESAAGQYPVESVEMMNRIILKSESDPLYRTILEAVAYEPESTAADAITQAARQVAATISAVAIVTYTSTGSTTLRAARERPNVPILALTPNVATARRLAQVWGVHPVVSEDLHSDFGEMIDKSISVAIREGFAVPGQRLVITAGMPFGTPGATNILRIAWAE